MPPKHPTGCSALMILSLLVAVIGFGIVVFYDPPSGPGAPLEGIGLLIPLLAACLASVALLVGLLGRFLGRGLERIRHPIKLRLVDPHGIPAARLPVRWEEKAFRPDLALANETDQDGWVTFTLLSGTLTRCSATFPNGPSVQVSLHPSDDGSTIEIRSISHNTHLRHPLTATISDHLSLCPDRDDLTLEIHGRSV